MATMVDSPFTSFHYRGDAIDNHVGSDTVLFSSYWLAQDVSLHHFGNPALIPSSVEPNTWSFSQEEAFHNQQPVFDFSLPTRTVHDNFAALVAQSPPAADSTPHIKSEVPQHFSPFTRAQTVGLTVASPQQTHRHNRSVSVPAGSVFHGSCVPSRRVSQSVEPESETASTPPATARSPATGNDEITVNGEGEIYCDVPGCGKTFRRAFNLRMHWKTHLSSDERIYAYKCGIGDCDSEFERPADLKRHEATHDGSKPYPCHDCGKRFKRKDTAQRHIANDCPTRRKMGHGQHRKKIARGHRHESHEGDGIAARHFPTEWTH